MLDRYKCILGSVAIGGIVTLEAIALLKGINGVALAASLAAIAALVAGLAGFEYGLKRQ